MLFMVIESLSRGAKPVAERFRRAGRVLPDGVVYPASWIDSRGAKCFQVIEGPDPRSLTPWIERWKDLVDFEIIPVLTSAAFSAGAARLAAPERSAPGREQR